MYLHLSETGKDQKTRRKKQEALSGRTWGKLYLSSYLSIEVMLLRNSCRRDPTDGLQGENLHSINAMELKVSKEKKKTVSLLF